MKMLLIPMACLSLSTAAWAGQTADSNCAGLRRLSGYAFSVVTSVLVPASGERPEHCRCSGQILPEVRFEVYLPTDWNQRFYMLGNGGYAGHFPRAPGYLSRRLQQGFAVAVTDTGHDSSDDPLASFAVNRQKLLDFCFRAVHLTATTAKEVIRNYYGTSSEWAYFEGCSTGGRQGLILAQRFPEDFDGLVVGAPILNETGQRISQAWIARANSEAPIPKTKLQLLADTIYDMCDPKDGLTDGLIRDPRSCGFDASRDLPQCEGETDYPNCFSRRQIDTLEKIYGDVMSRGRRIYPGLPVGAEIRAPGGRCGWDDWVIGDRDSMTANRFARSFFRYMAFPEPEENFQLADLDFDMDPGRMDWIRTVLNAADLDLTRFKVRGGKMLMYFGWSDAAVNPISGIEYYEQVLKHMGDSTPDFFRLFMVPGMFHCVGGVGPNLFDKLEPLMNWVEKGLPPTRIVASQQVDGEIVRTRPVCPYPQGAVYSGSGSIDEADNFSCREPQDPLP